MDEMDKAAAICLSGPQAEQALSALRDQPAAWGLAVPPEKPHALRCGADVRARPVTVTGGDRRSGRWVRLLSERLGVPVSPIDADPLLGAAKLARVAAEAANG